MTDIPSTFRLSEPAGFAVNTGEVGGRVVVAVAGELDVLTAPLLWERLEPLIAGVTDGLVVDLADTRFVDSMGVGVFVRAHKRLTSQGARLVLRSPGEHARKILELTGLDGVFEIEA